MSQLKIHYETKIEQRKIEGKLYVLETIKNLESAIDQLCESLGPEGAKDPFAEHLCPYFGVLWVAAEGLAQYIIKNKELFIGKSVLELGCGLGFPSMVATSIGAHVLATDFHPEVEDFFRRNLVHSNLKCSYQTLNWRDHQIEIGQFDIVMGSDILYEAQHPIEVAKGLLRYVKPGGFVLLSDPARSYMDQFLKAMKHLGHIAIVDTEKIRDEEVFTFKFQTLGPK
jgi:predicted nicotinamide N-methyase